MKHPDLASIFRSSDQNALIHNYVTSQDPSPGAWSHQSEPQSPLGRINFPLVLTINRGEVYTRRGPFSIAEEMMTEHEWLPWSLDGRGAGIDVSRSVGEDVFHGRVSLRENFPGLLLLECVAGGGMYIGHPSINIDYKVEDWGLTFRWEDRFEIQLRLSGGLAGPIRLADDPALLRRVFAGFDDVELSAGHQAWAWKGMRRLWVGVEFTHEVEVTFAVGRPGRVQSAGVTAQALRERERRRWETFFDTHVPEIQTKDPVVRDAYYFGWQMLWSNRCSGGSGQTPSPFFSPARMHYGTQWWWDEAFTSAIVRHLPDRDLPYQFLENFRRSMRGDGVIIGCLDFTADPDNAPPPVIGMQPPVFAVVLQLLREKPGWPRDLRPLYDMLLLHAKWYDTPERDTDGDGLVEYHDCNDSGLDQTLRWDDQKPDPTQAVCPLRPTEAVDFNAWTSVLWDVLGDMAEVIGDATAASAHRSRARRIMELVDEHMWDEADGFYYDIDAASHRKLNIKSPFAFMVMLSRHARKDRVERLVREHLLNEREFWTRFPLPSISIDNPKFDPVDMFRGSTWVMANWLVIEGLMRQGYRPEAMALARKTVELVGSRYDANGRRTRSPRLFEWYDPLTGKPLGNAQYSWSALVIDLILRYGDAIGG